MAVDCVQCGGAVPRPSWRGRKAAEFCGNICKIAYQRIHHTGKKATKECEECSKSFDYYPSKRPNAKYCSRPCRYVGQAKLMRGTKRVAEYRNIRSFRITVRKRLIDKCTICGWNEAPCDVAHIVAKKDGGPDHIDNVTMLCPNHHRMFDRGFLSIATVKLARKNCLPH